ncbi:Flagellar hook-associated protein 2 [bioreactor metagenome]|uniref:Flagellar hook-associated protein 2 n=1 Tax=bioreactor metagenome TaxID=1076179 RepID=A0A645HU71_9ZZZZ
MYEAVTNGIKYIADKAGSESSLSTVDNSYIGKRLTELKEDIEEWEDRLEDIETRYYNQFTAMETFINQMNTQSSWLASMFSSGS